MAQCLAQSSGTSNRLSRAIEGGKHAITRRPDEPSLVLLDRREQPTTIVELVSRAGAELVNVELTLGERWLLTRQS
jgi:hypothetical protein